MEDGLMFGFSDKYQAHSLFIVSRLLTKIQLSVQGLLLPIVKPIKNECLSTVKHDCISLFWQQTNRKHFLFAHGIIWNSTCLPRHGSFNRDLLVVTLVQYYISIFQDYPSALITIIEQDLTVLLVK